MAPTRPDVNCAQNDEWKLSQSLTPRSSGQSGKDRIKNTKTISFRKEDSYFEVREKGRKTGEAPKKKHGPLGEASHSHMVGATFLTAHRATRQPLAIPVPWTLPTATAGRLMEW